jgi:hypothetical protein
MKTFVICVTIVFIFDSLLQVVCAKKKVPTVFAVSSGILDIVLACWGLKLLGIL